jgi:sulfonate transport system substrate-binding protein
MSILFNKWIDQRHALIAVAALLSACGGATTPAATSVQGASAPATASGAKPTEIRLDYATYNLSSLVLQKNGWLEQEFAPEGITIKWVFSAGSNKANEYISSNSADFASTAGAAALLARTNGVPLKTVYVYSKPEWTALVVPKGSAIKKVEDLKGKKIAVTRGTDPFFFLLRSLEQAGLSQADVEIVNLQHADGRLALQRGNVDAWAGLDPHMAAAELQDGATLLYRNIDFNTFGTLNAREEFVQKYPEYAKRVIAQYERARKWILEHPDDAARLLAEAGKIDLTVAQKQIKERTVLDKDVGIPGEALQKALQAVVPILTSEKLVAGGADPAKALSQLIDPAYAQAATGATATK